VVADHVQQLIEEGLLEGVVVRDRIGVPCGYSIIRLTSRGHDFVDATRSQNFWNKTKGYVTKSLPGWTLAIVKEIAERAIKGEIRF
jgi:predicted TIM-barrel fold metal-dependent hydrolase